MVVAPGRMIDSFLSIPDAESLPLYRMVLKLACVCVWTSSAAYLPPLATYRHWSRVCVAWPSIDVCSSESVKSDQPPGSTTEQVSQS
jgi:hypothetical protein